MDASVATFSLEQVSKHLPKMSKACAIKDCPNEAKFKCGRCWLVDYCSKQCQKLHWKVHKTQCKKKGSNPLPMPSTNALIPLDRNYGEVYSADLEEYFFLAAGLKSVEDMDKSNEADLFKDDYSIESLETRWQEVSPALQRFIRRAVAGDIFLEKQYMPYIGKKDSKQQFRNTPPNPTALKNGVTIIEIGFVDFGTTIDSANSINEHDTPVTVFAYDKEPLCIAKSLVMLEMMKDHSFISCSIAEVWLSSLWSEETHLAFKRALSSLIKTSQPKSVAKIIKFWEQACKSKLSKAATLKFWRSKCLDHIPSACVTACVLPNENNRVEFLRYVLTGALFEDESTCIGSVVMCHENESIGVMQGCELCTEAAPTYIHFDDKRLPSESYMSRFCKYFLDKLDVFMNHIRGGTLVYTPLLAEVSRHHHIDQ